LSVFCFCGICGTRELTFEKLWHLWQGVAPAPEALDPVDEAVGQALEIYVSLLLHVHTAQFPGEAYERERERHMREYMYVYICIFYTCMNVYTHTHLMYV
jgi:hypothetical protein